MAGSTRLAAELEAGLARNLRLIPVHESMASALFWLPVFVLFTRARFDLDGALLLAGLYYLFVVVVEVPSGWMSDRVGRVPTLRIAAVAWMGAHSCFALGDDRFAVMALGQFLLAVGFGFLSGTDVSFHYDSLEALGRADEYADRQARVKALGYLVAAASGIVGGSLGLIDLRLAFVASLAVAGLQVAVTLALHEPPRTGQAEALFRQVGTCLRYLRRRYLGWLFFYGIAMVTLEHVAFTLAQPWLTRALDQMPDELGSTPFVAGVIFAIVAAVGSIAARASAPVAGRIGTVATLVGLGALSAAIVTGMAVSYSLAIVVPLAFRSAQGAAAPVLLSEAFASRTAQHHRATLLSLNSLAGRLGYGLILAFVSVGSTDDPRPVLRLLALLSWALVAVLVVTGVAVARRERLAAS